MAFITGPRSNSCGKQAIVAQLITATGSLDLIADNITLIAIAVYEHSVEFNREWALNDLQ